jgi:hypothetical protein
VGGHGISPSEDEVVDDLPELVDRAVDVAPLTGDLHIGFADLPAVTDGVPTRPAASASSGVKRCTHRWIATWSTSIPRSARSSSTSR